MQERHNCRSIRNHYPCSVMLSKASDYQSYVTEF